MTDGQLKGSILIMLLALLVSCLSFPGTSDINDARPIPFSGRASGTVVVELDGTAGNSGIYFVSPGTSVSDLLTFAEQYDFHRIDRRILDARLVSGDRVFVPPSGDLPAGPTIGRISAATRLALEMPIDLNSSTMDDLMLIPGIGEKTAERIVSYRSGIGSFRKVEQLKNIKGIKEKRFKNLSRYFYLDTGKKI